MKAFFHDVYQNNKRLFLSVLVWTVLSGFMGGVGVVMIVPMLSLLEISTETTGILGQIVTVLSGLDRGWVITTLLVAYLILVSGKAIITSVLTVWDKELVEGYTKHLQMDFYDAVFKTDWQKYKSYKKSQLENYFYSETMRLSSAATGFVRLIHLGISMAINIMIVLFMSIPVTLAALVLGILFFFLFRFARQRSRAYGKKLQDTSERFFDEVDSQMHGIKEIRSYGIQKQQEDRFEAIAEEYKRVKIDYAKLTVLPSLFISIGSAIAVVAVFLLAYVVLHLSIARIAVMVLVLARLMPNFSAAQNHLQYLLTTLPVYHNMCDVMEDLRKNKAEEIEHIDRFDFKEKIEYRDLSFSYADSELEEELIEHVNVCLRRGEITAFVGRSGAGKTTLVDIVLGFLQPTGGQILVDGKPMDKKSYAAFCTGVSYIPQEPMLRDASIRENLECFHPGAAEEEMIAALKKAQIWDMIEKLPNGLDTTIGDSGIRLSGGERQRIVLARALMGNPKLLVLDEATSALDFENEKKIRDILISLRGELTVLLVAHRLSTIRSAEHVIVIENGTITEDGYYSELIQNRDGYLGRMVNDD